MTADVFRFLRSDTVDSVDDLGDALHFFSVGDVGDDFGLTPGDVFSESYGGGTL